MKVFNLQVPDDMEEFLNLVSIHELASMPTFAYTIEPYETVEATISHFMDCVLEDDRLYFGCNTGKSDGYMRALKNVRQIVVYEGGGKPPPKRGEERAK